MKLLCKVLRAVWIASILGFFIFATTNTLIQKNSSSPPNIFTTHILVSIGIGILSFLFYSVCRTSYAKNREKTTSKVAKEGFLGLFICLLGLVIISQLSESKSSSVLGESNNSSIQMVSPIPSGTPVVGSQNIPKKTSEPLVECQGPDGKTFQTTQDECNSFRVAWGETQQPVQSSSQNPGYTYTYTPKTYYNCTLCYHYPYGDSCSTYSYLYETKEQCNAAQVDLDNLVTKTEYSYTTPVPTVKPDYSQQNSQCKMWAKQWYDNQGTQCSGSCAEAAKQIMYPTYQAKLAECDILYPL